MRQTDTGALIAQLRKEQGLTQKQLAEQLHISDRTISKWERGAGFPDVSLLEPLADALHCSVVSLLEGRLVEEPAEIDVRSALAVLIRESRSALRRERYPAALSRVQGSKARQRKRCRACSVQ